MTVLGLDFGEKRLGFAVSDPDETFAMPSKVVQVESEAEALETVCRVSEESGANRLVVGIPYNMDGSSGPMAEKVLDFVRRIRNRTSIPVCTWDERMTTAGAERLLIEADMSRAKRRRTLDKLAAQTILDDYLAAKAAGNTDAGLQ